MNKPQKNNGHELVGVSFIDRMSGERINLPAMPDKQVVASGSAIKIDTVTGVSDNLYPGRIFDLKYEKVVSDVPEQPFGWQTVQGALNRLNAAIAASHSSTDGVAFFAIENGLFKVGDPHGADEHSDILLFGEGADLDPDFDASAEYEDRTVVALKLPGLPTLIQFSPRADAVVIPKQALLEAHAMPGGFDKNTVGLALYQAGIVKDMQNPHIELTGGRLSRQSQIAHAIELALQKLAALATTEQPRA